MRIYFSILLVLCFIIYGFRIDDLPDNVYIKSGYETIYGKNFMYQLKTPLGYRADIPAKSINEGNIKFLPVSLINKPFEFYVLDKSTNQTKDAVGYISNYYSSRYENISIHNIEVQNFPYECTAKMYSVNNQFYDYIFYINCGTRFKYWVIASIHCESKPMSAKDLEVFYNTMLTLNPIK